jgi:hypothetical protein
VENFTFVNTTKIIFGKGTESEVGKEAAQYSRRILLHYGNRTEYRARYGGARRM